MLSREDWLMIQSKAREGVYQKDIAHELGVHPKTVSRALKRGGAPRRARRRDKFAKLASYMAKVDELLSANVWNAVVIYREIQALGYSGKLTVLRDYIRPKRALRPSRATVRFETPPGKQAQTDWGETVTEIGGVEQKVYVAVTTLGYSRRFYVWATDRLDAEHTYESLVRAFEWFGGVTEQVLVDNQKAAVLEHRIGQAVRFHPGFLDLAQHYGFTPKACRPARAQTKGKDERNVGYVKHHFFVRYRRFESFAHLNQRLERWLVEEADARFHGTVKEVVADRFVREQPALAPLPAVRFDTSYRDVRQVAWDSYIEVRGNRYAVPADHCGRSVAIRIGLDGRLRVFSVDDTLIAEHRLTAAENGWVKVPAYHTALWAQAVQQRPLSAYEEAA